MIYYLNKEPHRTSHDIIEYMHRMERNGMIENKEAGISVIISTNKLMYKQQIIDNYTKQTMKNKELILILNNEELSEEDFKEYQEKDPSIHVYTLDSAIMLGTCLNYAVMRAHYDYIARIDDDDYYGANYLQEIYDALVSKKGDIVGKVRNYVYFMDEKILFSLKEPVCDMVAESLPGGTISFHKDVFKKLQFSDIIWGEDNFFCRTAAKMGLKVYATSKNDFIYIRYNNMYKHTWRDIGLELSDPRLYDFHPNMSFDQVAALVCQETK